MTSPTSPVTIPVTDLGCMDGANMAAVALQMQKTALEAEQRIFTLEQQLRAADNRPTIIQRSTALITGIVADPFSGEQSVGPFASAGTWVTDFDNAGTSSNIDSSSRTLIGTLGEGLYEIGISVNLIASGVVTVDSYRLLRIVISRADPTAVDGQRAVHEASLTLFESNTGIGVDMTLVDEFRLEATDRIKFLVQHSNAGSTLNSSIGALVWLHKQSSNDSVVVV